MTNRRGAIASGLLAKALIDLAARGLRTHCSDPQTSHMWLSESESERAQAARLCNGCPVSLECWGASVARREEFGVWSGVDRTVRHARGKATQG
jgi:hypothetical protein